MEKQQLLTLCNYMHLHLSSQRKTTRLYTRATNKKNPEFNYTSIIDKKKKENETNNPNPYKINGHWNKGVGEERSTGRHILVFISVTDVVIVPGVWHLPPPFSLVVTAWGFSIKMCCFVMWFWCLSKDLGRNVVSLINSKLCGNSTFCSTWMASFFF